MKAPQKLTLFIVLAYLSSTSINAQDTLKHYHLVWSDEFNTDGIPDSLNWKYEHGFVRNKELQWYQPQNAYCKNGLLIIEGRREKIPNPKYTEGCADWKRNRPFAEYTSASLITKGLHSWKYGRFEIKARIDTSCGLWPAIWTLGDSAEWPQNGEIDLLEFYRIKQVPHILANTAWGTNYRWVAKWNSQRIPLFQFTNSDPEWSSKFHVWRMDWDENTIKLFLDNELLNTTQLNQTQNPGGFNPFQQKHYLILNLAIGENGGDPTNTTFPRKYEVDYVRVYQQF